MAGGGATIDVPSPGPMPPGGPATVPAVRLTGVRKTFGDVVAVEDLTLDVLPGEFFTMLGPSGSGKTTTLRVIAGFELADTGTVELHGVDVTRSPPYERPLNTVFQDYALFPHMSVAENVAYGLRVKGVGRRSGASARRRRSRWCACRTSAHAARSSSRAASASAWRWHARSSTARACCCSTSRSARST